MEDQGAATVFKSTDATAGSFSCEVGAAEINGDTLRGYVFHGTVGQQGPDGGIPYTDNFNEIQVQYKGNLNGDTLVALVIRYNAGVMTGMEAVGIATGNTSAWTGNAKEIKKLIVE